MYTLVNNSPIDPLSDASETWRSVEGANSKLVDVVTVADVDVEECVGNSLLEILTLNIVQDIEAEVW